MAKALPIRADGRFFEVGLSQSFLEYGLWQDYGTGKETPLVLPQILRHSHATEGVPRRELRAGILRHPKFSAVEIFQT